MPSMFKRKSHQQPTVSPLPAPDSAPRASMSSMNSMASSVQQQRQGSYGAPAERIRSNMSIDSSNTLKGDKRRSGFLGFGRKKDKDQLQQHPQQQVVEQDTRNRPQSFTVNGRGTQPGASQAQQPGRFAQNNGRAVPQQRGSDFGPNPPPVHGRSQSMGFTNRGTPDNQPPAQNSAQGGPGALPARGLSESPSLIIGPDGANPKWKEEFEPIVELISYQPHKTYVASPPELEMIFARTSAGQQPKQGQPGSPSNDWDSVWLQLSGTSLSMWSMKETRAAAALGTKVPPTYFNITESTLELLNKLPPPPHRPNSHPHNHVFSLNTAGSNRLLFSAPTDRDLIRWTTGLRLAAWERSRLEEIYTGHLIRAGRREPRSPLVNGRLEGWTRVRVMGGVEWHRLWLVLSDPEAPSAPDANSQRRRHSLFGIGGNQHDTIQEPNTGVVMASFYTEPRTAKNRTSSLPVLQISAVTQAYAVFPERLEVISQSNLMKVVGRISGSLVTIEGGLRDSGWALVMPEAAVEDPAPPTPPSPLGTMMRWVTAFHDAFKLYGRPGQYNWDSNDPRSLWFAYPRGEFRGDLFLNIDEASMANHRVNTPGIRALFLNLVARRMAGGSDGKEAESDSEYTKAGDEQKANSAFTLPPLSFNDDKAKPSTPPPPVPEHDQATQLAHVSRQQQPQTQTQQQPQSPQQLQSQQQPQTQQLPQQQLQSPQQQQQQHLQQQQQQQTQQAARSPAEPQFQPGQQPQLGQQPQMRAVPPHMQQQQDPRSLTPITEAEASRQNSTRRPEDAAAPSHAVGQAITANQAVLPQRNVQQQQQQPGFLPVTDEGNAMPIANRSNSSTTFGGRSGEGEGLQTSENVENLTTPASQTQTTVWSQESGGPTPTHGSAVSLSTAGGGGGAPVVSGTSSPPGFRGGTSPAPPAGAEAAQPQTKQQATSVSPPGQLSGVPAAQRTTSPPSNPPSSFKRSQYSTPSEGPLVNPQAQPQSDISHNKGTMAGAAAGGAAVVGAAAFGAAALSSRPSDGSRSGGSHQSDTIHHPRPHKRLSVTSEQPVAGLRDEPAAMYLMNMVEEPTPITNQSAQAHKVASERATRPTINTSTEQQRPDINRRPSGARAYPSPAVRSTSNGSREVSASSEKAKPAADMRSPQQPQATPEFNLLPQINTGQTQTSTAPKLPPVNTNQDIASDAAAYLAYADGPDPAAKAPQAAQTSPPVARSSFAPSKAATERRAKAEAQTAEQQRSMAVPGGGKRQQRANVVSTHEDWSDEEDEAEEDEEDVTSPTAGSHGPDFSRRGSRALPLPPGQQQQQPRQEQQRSQSQQFQQQQPYAQAQQQQYPQQQQQYQQPQQQQQYQQSQQQRPLPARQDMQTNGNGHAYDAGSSPRSRSPAAPHRHLPAQPQQQQRDQRVRADAPAPPAARQNVWNANFAVDHGMNEPPKGGKFVELEEPSVALTKAFSPGGLLQAGMQDKQDRSAKRQEEVARETGSSLVNVPEKPPPPQTGLMGAVAAHERDRKNPGGLGATLTDRDRDRRIAEERQRKIEDLQRQQMEQYGMPMGPQSMYGGFQQFPPYMQPPMQQPMYQGYMGPHAQQQAMMAAQMAYQQTMMAMSHAGSQAGDAPEQREGRASPTASVRTSPQPFQYGYGMGFMPPSQSMYGFPQYGMGGMPMGGMMPNMGVNPGMSPPMQGMSPGQPGWASPQNYRGSMHEGSYAGHGEERQAS